MKENSVIFPLTNPSQPPDKGRRLATSARPCQKSQIRVEIASSQRSSGECRFLGVFSMCVVCDVSLGRRGFLSLAGAGVAASLLPF